MLCLCIFYNYSMNIAIQCKTQNHTAEDKYSTSWEWSECNMIFSSLKWDISAKRFHFQQSAFLDQNPLPAQNYKDRHAKLHLKVWTKSEKITKKIRGTCSSAPTAVMLRLFSYHVNGMKMVACLYTCEKLEGKLALQLGSAKSSMQHG